jgi:hypothetical protein
MMRSNPLNELRYPRLSGLSQLYSCPPTHEMSDGVLLDSLSGYIDNKYEDNGPLKNILDREASSMRTDVDRR